MSLQFTTVAKSISQIVVPGVNILDLTEITPEMTRKAPILFPEPLNYLTDFTVGRDSYGASYAKMTASYILHYTYLHVRVGEERGSGLNVYQDMVTNMALILDKILATDDLTGSVDFWPESVTELGPVPDPTGNQYLGCRLAIRVEEFIN